MGEHKRITDPAIRAANRARYEANKLLKPEPKLTVVGWGRKFRREVWWEAEKLARRLRGQGAKDE